MKPHVAELRERYADVFGEQTTSRYKRFLQKRIAWALIRASSHGCRVGML